MNIKNETEYPTEFLATIFSECVTEERAGIEIVVMPTSVPDQDIYACPYIKWGIVNIAIRNDVNLYEESKINKLKRLVTKHYGFVKSCSKDYIKPVRPVGQKQG